MDSAEFWIFLKKTHLLVFPLPTFLKNVTGYLYISIIFAVVILNYYGKCKPAY